MKSRNAIKYLYHANPVYIHFKKHYCPQCNKRVSIKYSSIIINSDSPEAKNYDFCVGDTFLTGDVEFKLQFFYCDSCQLQISCEDMKKSEKRRKGTGGRFSCLL